MTDYSNLLIDFGHGLNLARAEAMILTVGNLNTLPEQVVINMAQ